MKTAWSIYNPIGYERVHLYIHKFADDNRCSLNMFVPSKHEVGLSAKKKVSPPTYETGLQSFLLMLESSLVQYVIDNVAVFGPAAVTIFGVGWGFGRFMFDRQVGASKTEIEILNMQLTAARSDVVINQKKLEELMKAQSTVSSTATKARAGSRLMSAIAMSLVIALLGAVLYGEKVLVDAQNWNASRENATVESILTRLDSLNKLAATNKLVPIPSGGKHRTKLVDHDSPEPLPHP